MLILKKLLSNALRYTEKGEIHFGYQSLYPVSVQFYVSDTGNGIPKDKLGHIFERVVQLGELGGRERFYLQFQTTHNTSGYDLLNNSLVFLKDN